MPTEGSGGTSVARRPSSALVAQLYDAAEQASEDMIELSLVARNAPGDRQAATTAAWKLCRSVPHLDVTRKNAGDDELVELIGRLLADRPPATHGGHSAATWLDWVLDLECGLARALKECCRGYVFDVEFVPFEFAVSEIMDHWNGVANHLDSLSQDLDSTVVAAGLIQERRSVQARLAATEGASTNLDTGQFVFRLERGRWHVHFGDEAATLDDRAGMQTIWRILGWPPTQTSEEALTLDNPTANVDSAPRGLEHVDVEGIDGMIASLQSQLESASGKAEEDFLEEQLDQLRMERQRRTNIRGKSRMFGDERAKAADRVHKAITRPKGAINHIAVDCPKLADYLRGIGRSGTEITFSPNARYDWQL